MREKTLRRDRHASVDTGTGSRRTDGLRLESAAVLTALGTLAWTLLVLAAFADVATTVYAVSNGLPESNPLMEAVITEYGRTGLIASKLVGIGLVAVVAVDQYFDNGPVWSLYPPAIAALGWMVAAAWNAYVISLLV